MLSRQSVSLVRRTFSSNGLGSELNSCDAKPFSAIPTLSVMKVLARSLPGGKYYNKSMREMNRMFYDEFGNIFKIPPLLGNPEIVMTFSADDMEKVCTFYHTSLSLLILIDYRIRFSETKAHIPSD